MDEFTTALIMFNQPHPVAPGGLVALHDSGGERQLLVDLADELDVSIATLSGETTQTLESILDPGLPAVNPLDAWSAGGPDYHRIMENCLAAMMRDPAASMGAVVHDRAPDGKIYTDYFDYMRKGHGASGKPTFLVSNRQGTGSDPAVTQVTREGFPVLDGLRSFLVGARALMDFRDFQARRPEAPPLIDENLVSRWRNRLEDLAASGASPDESTTLQMLEAFGIPAVSTAVASSESELLEAAAGMTRPLVLKTAEPGIVHKSDVGGVIMDIGTEADLKAAYADLADRLGPRAVVMPQVTQAGQEMVLGMFVDEQFGPLVMLGFGGRDLEAEGHVGFLLPPFGADVAHRTVKALPGYSRLEAWRGRAALNVDAFCKAASRFSVMVSCLAETILELDVNPVVVHRDGCMAVDAYMGLEESVGAAPGPRCDARWGGGRRGVGGVVWTVQDGEEV
jgi:acyl-CoA synthetase (NDP forming)